MPKWLKIIWIFAIFMNSLSIISYVLKVTDNFQSSINLVEKFTFALSWAPSVLLVVLSIWVLIRKWTPPGVIGFGAVGLIIILQLILSLTLYSSVQDDNWLQDNVKYDSYQVTSEGKIKYRLEIVNHHQNNSYERLHIIYVETGKEQRIRLNLGMSQSTRILMGDENGPWSTMNPTDTEGQYLLSTTRELGIPKKVVVINIPRGTTQVLK